MRTAIVASLALAGCQYTSLVVGGLQEIVAMKTVPGRSLDVLFVRFRRQAPVADDSWTHVRCQVRP